MDNSQDSSSKIITNGPMDLEQVAASTCNEPLLGGFALLRAAQLLNIDIYYIRLGSRSNEAAKLNRRGDLEAAAKIQHMSISSGNKYYPGQKYYRTFLDELADYNPLQKYIDRSHLLDSLCKFLKICLSLVAIMIEFDKAISTIILCIITRIDSPHTIQTNSNSSMGLFVLILVNLSSMYILYSTVFNGHLLWNLLSQRLFLVSKRFQYKTMLFLLLFIYLEYLVNISFINNLYEWDFTSNNIQSGSYSVLANLRILVTDQDEEHYYIDILLTILQFARGIIRISPYIVINYSIICLKEHIHTIRNQHLLTDSLKKRQKLRLVVRTRPTMAEVASKSDINGSNRKKKVIFMTDGSNNNQATKQQQPLANNNNIDNLPANEWQENATNEVIVDPKFARRRTLTNSMSVVSKSASTFSEFENNSKLSNLFEAQQTINNTGGNEYEINNKDESSSGRSNDAGDGRRSSLTETEMKRIFLVKIRDFDELESYITNLYIFTGRLNRFMSQQGLTVFFIVHNLVISVSVIMPETVRGGIVMVYIIRILVIIIGITPFCFGQSLNQQLEQLSRQIDRIIIQQQFIHRRRDNLVRIRELVHDIRVNCGGMLNFNVETGIKYILLAFASAFFIEQERKLSTSSNKTTTAQTNHENSLENPPHD